MSNRPVNLILGFHNHQPVGNFDHVFNDAVDHSYLPFLKVVEKYPKFRFALHNSGCLWEWLEDHRADYFDHLGPLVERGQVELLGGGFYEPILPSIPHRDRVAQLDKMREYLDRRFGVQFRGIWLTERVWETGLVRSLVAAGVEYLSVDDFHFGLVGIQPEHLHGYYLTEDEGEQLAVFPIDQKLRYLTPFHAVEEVKHYVDSVRHAPTAAKELGVVLPILDDGEKYGTWPGTHKWVYTDGWLDKFCKYLSNDANGVVAKLPGEIIDTHPALGTIYLPDTSYQEMGIWALPPHIGKIIDTAMHQAEAEGRVDEARRLFNAAPWRNFLVKYPEAGRLQKRMLFMSKLVNDAASDGHLDAAKIAEAQTALFRSQCNCAYWHGVFGGLYLPHLRRALYENLIAADTALFEAEKAANGGDLSRMVEVGDFDADGYDETVVRLPGAAYWFQARGGAMFGWDIRRNRINILNSLARHPEMYHDAPVADSSSDDGHGTIHEMQRKLTPKQKEALVYDWYPRINGLDHFFPRLASANDLRLNRLRDEGDFVTAIYAVSEVDWPGTTDTDADALHVVEADGAIYRDHHRYPLHIVKGYTFAGETGGFEYAVKITLGKEARHALDTWYAPEFNFAFFTGEDPERRHFVNGKHTKLGECVDAEAAEFRVQSLPENLDISLTAPGRESPVAWRAYPVETVSQSERGFEMNLQSAAVVPHFHLKLAPGESATITVRIAVGENAR